MRVASLWTVTLEALSVVVQFVNVSVAFVIVKTSNAAVSLLRITKALLEMTTESSAPGTAEGFQFAELNQLLSPLEPVHTRSVALAVISGAMRRRKNAKINNRDFFIFPTKTY